jgi:internalin A
MSTDHLSGFLQILELSLASEALAALPDHQLLERILTTQDEMSFRIIISRHGPMVYRVCRRVLPDEQDSEDAFQAAFLILIRKAGLIRKRMSLASWLHGVAYQVALRVRTSSQRRRIRELQTAAKNESISTDERSWKEVRIILDEELARLPEKVRAPLILCYLEGLTQDEAAGQLGQSKRTLRRYLERGRALLGVRLTRRGLAYSGAAMATLIADCVEALPVGLEQTTTTILEAIHTEKSALLSSKVSSIADEVIKTMFPTHLNLKWLTVVLLGVGLGSVAFGSLFAETQPNAASATSFVLQEKNVPSNKAPESNEKAAPQRLEMAVDKVRKEAIDFLKKKQGNDGRWAEDRINFLADMEGGATALAALSLLEAGVPADDATIKKAVDYLVQLPLKKTYIVSLQIQVLARVDAKKHKEQIQKNADWLVKEAVVTKGKFDGWSYPGNAWGDGSNTHFAVMGLHAAKQSGAKVEEKIWLQIAELYLSTRKDKGWRYYYINDTDFASSNSMTVCALLGIEITSNYLKDTKELAGAFEKGLGLLQSWDLFSEKSSGYAMMVAAELGRLHGKKQFKVGDKTWDWYRIGAEKLIKSQKKDGSLVLDGNRTIDSVALLSTSFGLYFLGPPEPSASNNSNPAKPAGDEEPLGKILKRLTGDVVEINMTMSPEVIKAWESAGVQYGRFEKKDESVVFFRTRPPNRDDLPAFYVNGDLKLSELPAPNVPFGIVCRRITNATLKELANFKLLQTLDLSDNPINDADLKPLASLKQLQWLVLSYTQVTDAGMKELVALKQLRTLDLGHTKVTDAGMKEVAAFEQLRRLYLPGTLVTDVGVKHISALSQLEILLLGDTQVTNACVKELASFTKLKMLVLRNTQVTEAGLKELSALQQLETLSLSVPELTGAGMREVALLKQLHTLELNNMKVTVEGMKELGSLAKLQRLTFARVSLPDEGMKELASLKQLHTLDFVISQVTDAASKELAGLTQLRKLNLSITQITDTGFKELAALKQLEELIYIGKQVTDTGVKELAALKRLKTLALEGAPLTEETIKELTALKELKTLRLAGTQMTEAGLKELSAFTQLETLAVYRAPVTESVVKEFAALKQLRTLILSDALVTDSVVKELAALKQLQTLDLRKTLVTDEGIKALAALKQLQTLELYDTVVTDAGMKELRKALPLCRIYK